MENSDTYIENELKFAPQILPNLDFSNLRVLESTNHFYNKFNHQIHQNTCFQSYCQYEQILSQVKTPNHLNPQYIRTFPFYSFLSSNSLLEDNFKLKKCTTNFQNIQSLVTQSIPKLDLESEIYLDNGNNQPKDNIRNNNICKKRKRGEKLKANTRAPYVKHRCKCWYLNLPATKHLYNGTPCTAEFCKLRTGFREQKNWKERLRVASLKERQLTLKLLLEKRGFTSQKGRWTECNILTTATDFIRLLHHKITEVRGISYLQTLLPFYPKISVKFKKAKRDPNCFLKFSMYMRQEFKQVRNYLCRRVGLTIYWYTIYLFGRSVFFRIE